VANLHKAFVTFHDQIALSSVKKAVLRTVRDAIRERIRKYFRDKLCVDIPKFRGQGAYAIGTATNPLSGEYDIDDGVYLQHLDKSDSSRWFASETVHQWVIDATDGHPEEKPMNKKTCIRVRHAGQYHVDLPIYAELNGKLYLAECGAWGWHRSDPLALTDWFINAVKSNGEQLRRMIRCLKAWADFQSGRRGKMPNGLVLSVCAVRNFVANARDDIAMAKILRAIQSDTEGLIYLLNPVDLFEELTARLTKGQKIRFQEAIASAVLDAEKAIQSGSPKKAAILWRNQFGDRFPCVDEEE
jgi:hypothetical protein